MRWREGVVLGQKRSRKRKERKEEWLAVRRGPTIDERMVERRVEWIMFYKST